MKPPQKNVKIENKNKTVERRTARCEISPLLKFSSPAEGFFFQEEPKQNKIHQKIPTKNAIKVSARKKNGRMIHFRLSAVCATKQHTYTQGKNLSQFNTHTQTGHRGAEHDRFQRISFGPCVF
jgi:hypothetical protein